MNVCPEDYQGSSNAPTLNEVCEFDIRTVSTPNHGRRHVAVRRLPIADQASDSRMLTNMIEDRTDQFEAAAVAA
jgi:hypothetical protein